MATPLKWLVITLVKGVQQPSVADYDTQQYLSCKLYMLGLAIIDLVYQGLPLVPKTKVKS